MQRGERVGQLPTLQRRRLVEGADLLLEQRQEVHRIEDHVGLLVGPRCRAITSVPQPMTTSPT
jgi:hypothetical protein